MVRKHKKRKHKKQNQNWPLIKLLLFVSGLLILFISFGTVKTDFSSVFNNLPGGLMTTYEEQFIEELSPHAVILQEEYDILPSITIAQAILESNWGRSTLAEEENNYYGIKGHAAANRYATKEFTGEWIEVSEPFRSYSSLWESMEDYAKLLSGGTSWNADHYAAVLEARDYKEAAKALEQTGYATDPAYASKLIALIEKYDLNQYDH